MSTPIPSNRATFSTEEVCRVTGGTLLCSTNDSATGSATGLPSTPLTGVAVDSRQVQPGGLFVALVGGSTDGHRYIGTAVEMGAQALLVQHGPAHVPESVVQIQVPDTLVALGQLAHHHRLQWARKAKGRALVGLTGSVGKTTTKELLAAALQACGRRVLKTLGNLNNRIGVPMTLLTLDDTHDCGVIEMGTSLPGEIDILARIVQPDHGLLTAVAASHTEGLGTLKDVRREKWSLFRHVAPGGVVVIPQSEAEPHPEDLTGHCVVTFGTSDFGASGDGTAHSQIAVQWKDWSYQETALHGFAFTIAGEAYRASMALMGAPAGINAAAVLAMVHGMGCSVPRALQGLAGVAPVPGRLSPRSHSSGALVIDDSYNANPTSMTEALRTAAHVHTQRGGKGALHLCLGDMGELGERSRVFHLQVLALAAQLQPRQLCLVGPEFRKATQQLRRQPDRVDEGTDRSSGLCVVDDVQQAIQSFQPPDHVGDVVLIKASRSVALDRLVDHLCPPMPGEAVP